MNSDYAWAEWYSGLSQFFADEKRILFLGVVFSFVFAAVRLYQVRDSDGERLPPSFPAKAFFLLTHVLLYGLIVIALVLSPAFFTDVKAMAQDSNLPQFMRQIPLLAVVIVGFLFSLPQVKELERHYAIFLHSAQHRTVDEDRLADHLIACQFHPSDQERRLNDHYLHQFNLYITERDDNLVRLGSVDAWRKVNALLRRLRETDEVTQYALSAADRREVERLERAHRRKTALAVSIIRILNDLGSNMENTAKLARVTELLTSAAHADRDRITDAENMARTIIEAPGTPENGRPLRISEQQMMQYLSQIESYFIVEYTIILQNLSRLAAKNVIRAGDHSETRLIDLKRAGFEGLGSVEQVTFDRVIWVILITWIATFAGLSLPSLYIGAMPAGFVAIILSVSSTFSLAALVGAVWGARRSLAERRITPWASYLTAGLIAIAGFFLIQSLRFAFDRETAIARIVRAFPDMTVTYLDYLLQQAPFALSPLVITIAICRLARIRKWLRWPLIDLPERAKDGLMLGLLFIFTNGATRFLHKLFHTAYAVAPTNLDPSAFYVFQGAFFLLGFAIGFLIVDDVRKVAHSQVVETPAGGGKLIPSAA